VVEEEVEAEAEEALAEAGPSEAEDLVVLVEEEDIAPGLWAVPLDSVLEDHQLEVHQ